MERKVLFRSFFLVFLFFLPTCGKEEKDEELESIRTTLNSIIYNDFPKGNYAKAFTQLDDIVQNHTPALNRDPLLRSQVHFSLVVARTLKTAQDWLNTISLLAQIFFSGEFKPSRSSSPILSFFPEQIVDMFIDGFFNKSVGDFLTANLQNLQIVVQEPRFSIEYPSLPIRFEVALLSSEPLTLFDLKGKYDTGEAYLFSSLFRLFLGITQVVTSLNLDIGFGGEKTDALLYIGEQLTVSGDANPFKKDPVGTVSNLVAVLLSTQPSFLTLQNGSLMQAGGKSIGDAFQDLKMAISAMEKRSAGSDPEKYFVGFYPRGKYTKDPRMEKLCQQSSLVGCMEVHLTPGNFFQLLTAGFTPKNAPIPVSEDFLNAIENIQKSFSQEPGVTVKWSRDLVPLVSIAINTFIQSGLLEGILYIAVSQKVLDPSKLSGFLDVLRSDIVDPQLISAFLLGVIPDVIELDFGTYLKTPSSPRTFLPFYRKAQRGPDGKPDWKTATLLLEYECNDGKGTNFDPPVSGDSGVFLCPVGSIEDSPHFTTATTPWISELTTYTEFNPFLPSLYLLDEKISPTLPSPPPSLFGLDRDCVKNPGPYLTVLDPTLGKLLRIRLSDLIREEHTCLSEFKGQGFTLPTQETLNALSALLLEQVGSLMGSFTVP